MKLVRHSLEVTMRPVDKDEIAEQRKKREMLAENGHSPRTATPAVLLNEAHVQELFDYYRRAWEKEHKGPLVVQSYNGAKTLLRDVLRATSGDKVRTLRMLDLFFNPSKTYYKKMGHTLELFKHDMQQLAAESSIVNAAATALEPLRIKVETLCPECGTYFELECSVGDVDKVVLVTPCERCKGRKR